jgi:branched-chain amino acid transport system permease protein
MDAQVWVDGLYAGAVYALLALGLAIIFQPTRVVNFAQGEATVLGAVIGFQVIAVLNWGWWAALGIALVGGALLGLAFERMIMLPVQLSKSRFAWIIATLAVSLIFQSLYLINFSNDLLRPRPVLEGDLRIGGVDIAWQKVLIVLAALAIMVAFERFLRLSLYGRAIRAAAHDADTTVLMGVPVRRVVVLSYVLSTVITVVAGLLAAPVLFIEPASGLLFTVKGFTAAIIGGIGSPKGALVGGLVVGLLDSVVRNLVNPTAGNFVVVAALALILIAFPSGLFGKSMEGH